MGNLVKSVFEEASGLEEAVLRRGGHRVFAASESRRGDQRVVLAHACSDASFYNWRAKFGGVSVLDARRLKQLEAENTLLKLLAESLLENEATKRP